MPISCVVRTFNSAKTLTTTLESLSSQDQEIDVIVVDSGSSDGSIEIATMMGAAVVDAAQRAYSPGRSLNLGVQAASAPFVLILSSHTSLPDRSWASRAMQFFQSPSVIAACGQRPDLRDGGATYQSSEDARLDIGVGLTNTASLFRRDMLTAYPFNEQMRACEDKEWAVRVLTATGGTVALAHSLNVTGAHRRAAGASGYVRRIALEYEELIAFGLIDHPRLSDILGLPGRKSGLFPRGLSRGQLLDSLGRSYGAFRAHRRGHDA